MGYDLRLHIGEPSYSERDSGTEKKPTYLMQNSMVELCNVDTAFFNKLTKLAKESPFGYFYPDGNTKTTQDFYGDKLHFLPAKKVLTLLKQANKKEYYRRYAMAIALLEVVIKDFKEVVVMPFGH